jgi:hypothetical protein
MFIEHHAVEADLFGDQLLVKILVEQLTALDRIEVTVGISKETVLDHQIVRNVTVGALGKIRYVHGGPLVGR